MLSRRELVRAAAVAAGAAVAHRLAAQPPAAPAAGAFKLNPLPYAYDALEPVIDTETMTVHHTKHQQAYVTALNKALTDGAPAMLGKPIEEVVAAVNTLPKAVMTAVRNNGGGVFNHEFFWSVMGKPAAGSGPKGDLLAAIDASFTGGLDTFKKNFVTAGVGRFGSGWAWLVPGKEKPLEIVTTPNQDNPVMDGGPKPVLGVDVWEHAYYLKYRNLRKNYIEAWFGVVNWDAVAANFAAAKKGK